MAYEKYIASSNIAEFLAVKVDNKMRLATDRTFRVAADEAIRTVFKCSLFPEPKFGFGE